jgi:hypothetical protein
MRLSSLRRLPTSGEFLPGCACRIGKQSQHCQSQQGTSGELGIVRLPDVVFHLAFPWFYVNCGITSVMNSSSERTARSCGKANDAP